MRHLSIALAAALLLTVFVCSSQASTTSDQGANATSHVWLTVNPTIGVQAVTGSVNLGTLKTGEIYAPVTFRIDANTQFVNLSAIVTNLYKGDDGSSPYSIPVVVTKDVAVSPGNGHATNPHADVLAYVTHGQVSTPNGSFMGHTTEVVTFESSENGHYSMDVDLTPTWNNADAELPRGEYSGFVTLFSSIVL